MLFARSRLVRQLEARGAPVSEVKAAESSLDPQALTIGFGRRFATYKRATLLLGELDRLRAVLVNSDRPVQFVFAGKAHPHDEYGKGYIREIVHASRLPGLQGRLVFLEDYDMQVARYMVQGCDVWLNNPRRPLEASGTSGMKAVLNGGLHCSTLDGWWDEAYSKEVGWPSARVKRMRMSSTGTAWNPTRCSICSSTTSCRCSINAAKTACRMSGLPK